ncbi:hypothetical protein TNCV_555281 [Trichonephila clavipes]|nr:hypothetical protein TNCV_555281 [Trichonephila clavipes]
MVSYGISCHICSNCRARSSTFPGRCSRFPIIPQTCSIGERYGCLASQGSVLQVHSNTFRMRCGIILMKKKTRVLQMNGSKTVLRKSSTYLYAVNVSLITTKGIRLSKEIAAQTITPVLRACVAYNSESRINTMPWASPDTSSIIFRIQLEAGFISKHYTSPVSMIPTLSRQALLRRIQAHYEQLLEFERGRIIELKEAGWQIGESLVMWVEAMRPLEDAGKNEWTMADFSVMMVAVDLGPQQIGRTD